jgi:hypothetical protein
MCRLAPEQSHLVFKPACCRVFRCRVFSLQSFSLIAQDHNPDEKENDRFEQGGIKFGEMIRRDTPHGSLRILLGGTLNGDKRGQTHNDR